VIYHLKQQGDITISVMFTLSFLMVAMFMSYLAGLFHLQRTELRAAKKMAEQTRDALWGEMELAKKIQTVLDTNKAEEIATLNLRDKCSFADFMIVASGRAPRHVSALADYVGDMLKKMGIPPLSIEGKESGDWVLIDAGDIIVHIFRPEVRQFYNIEKMWALPAASY
jgi:ribosome-associated protein